MFHEPFIAERQQEVEFTYWSQQLFGEIKLKVNVRAEQVSTTG